jgi:hypothetical protein
MNVEIGAEAAQFPDKEFINGIAVAVQFKQASSQSTFINENCTPLVICRNEKISS